MLNKALYLHLELDGFNLMQQLLLPIPVVPRPNPVQHIALSF